MRDLVYRHGFLQLRRGLLHDVTGALWRLCMPQDYPGLGSVPGFGCREQQLRGFESDAGFTPMETLKRNRAPSSQNNPHNRIQPCICICMCIYIGILYIYIYIYIYGTPTPKIYPFYPFSMWHARIGVNISRKTNKLENGVSASSTQFQAIHALHCKQNEMMLVAWQAHMIIRFCSNPYHIKYFFVMLAQPLT